MPSSPSSPFVIHWGFMATGRISQDFAKDILIDPHIRGTDDVAHEIAAVSSSTTKAAAQEFMKEVNIPDSMGCQPYGSYEEVANDNKVDVVYVATPNSHHYQNAMLALRAGKHVLCEKPFTMNAEQTRALCREAHDRKLFLMEGLWTKFFPICHDIRDRIRKGEIGEVFRVFADTSLGQSNFEKTWDHRNRFLNKELGGGILMDSGTYSLSWALQCLLETLPSEKQTPPYVVSQLDLYDPTGVDETANMLVQFSRSTPTAKHKAHAIATASFRGITDTGSKVSGGPTVRIQGSKGEIKVFGRAYRPTYFLLVPRQEGQEPKKIEETFPGGGRGMYWEADEVARCVRAGKTNSTHMSWTDSVLMMEILDEVRRQNDFYYSEQVESKKYPLSF